MRPALIFTFTLLLIEFLDELVYGAQGAALPAIRTDLDLSYEQIGLLLSVPHIVGSLIEPALFILADTWKRKALIVSGGLAFALGLLLTAFGQTFATLLVAFTLLSPASGAFVSLAQATLMDLNPTRHEQMMARWTLFGSVGVVGGSLALSALLLVLFVWTQRNLAVQASGEQVGFVAGVRAALRALRDWRILRWLALLDILLGFAALYFVDVVEVSEAEGALAVTVLTTAGLIGNALIVPLLERVRGMTYLRWSAVVVLALYATMLVVPNVAAKYLLLACVGLGTSGWYAVLRGQLYSAMPGQSGTSLAISSLSGIVGGLLPGVLGFVAEAFGLPWTMALVAIAPISLLVGLPRGQQFSIIKN